MLLFALCSISESDSDCSLSTGPTSLNCLSTKECNRCRRTSPTGGTHEKCSGSTPVCDVDSAVAGIQNSGTNKLAECVKCKKTGKLILIHLRIMIILVIVKFIC